MFNCLSYCLSYTLSNCLPHFLPYCLCYCLSLSLLSVLRSLCKVVDGDFCVTSAVNCVVCESHQTSVLGNITRKDCLVLTLLMFLVVAVVFTFHLKLHCII